MTRIRPLAPFAFVCCLILVTLAALSPFVALAEDDKKSAETKPEDKKPADVADPADVPAGHSYHGDAFNEGPRQKAYLMGGTGPIQFAVTSKIPDVQKFIEQGIGQLHGFWYFEAERSFRHAAKLDPGCAIAYWGMALANVNNSKRAKGFIAKAVERKDKVSIREQHYIDALSAYINDSDRKKRAAKLIKAYEAIAGAFPDDLEAKAFRAYLLYRHRSTLKRDYKDVDKALNEVLAIEPMHPVHHFRIHLWDQKDPSKALNSSARCGQAASAIAHMWHMPGHIYARLERHHDAAWQQEASARVDHSQMMRYRVMPDQIHNFAHNNEWMIRSLTYIGRHQDAVRMAKNMIEMPHHPKYNTLKRRGTAYYGRLRLFSVLSQFELHDEMIAAAEGAFLVPTDRETEQIRRLRYLGVAYARKGNTSRRDEIVKQLGDRLVVAIELETKEAEKKAAAEKAAAEKAALEKAAAEKADKKDDIKDNKDNKDNKKDKAKPKKKSKPKPNVVKLALERAIAAIEGYSLLADGKHTGALKKLRTAKENTLDLARVQWLAGEQDAALKSAAAYMKKKQKRIIPLAKYTELLWLAGNKDDAKKTFETLRKYSGSLQPGSPVFERLTPIAKAMGLPDDWRQPHAPESDTGIRPSLDALGPYRWLPMPAADWTLPDAKGKKHSLADYRGKPVMVIFYLGYACLHCAEQLQAFAPMAAEFEKAGISLIAISTDNLEGLKTSIDEYEGKMPFPLVSDTKLDVFRRYRAFDDFEDITLHGTFLIDEKGLIRWQDIGYEPFMDPKFALAESKRLLAIKTPAGSLPSQYVSPPLPPRPVRVATKPADLNNPLKKGATAGLSSSGASKPLQSTAGQASSGTQRVATKPADLKTHLAALHAINPRGIAGSMILSGIDTPNAALATFYALAHGTKSRVVVLRCDASEKSIAETQRLLSHWDIAGGGSIEVIRAGSLDKHTATDRLSQATGVWIIGDDPRQIRHQLSESQLITQCAALIDRGGVIGGSAGFSLLASSRRFVDETTASTTDDTLDWLPDSIVDVVSEANDSTARIADALGQNAKLVGYEIMPKAALLVRGRRLLAIGEGSVRVSLASTGSFEARSTVLDKKHPMADLTGLRRFAIERSGPRFPVEKRASPVVEKGVLMIVGGGGMPPGLVERFIKQAGGKDASIIILPTAMPGRSNGKSFIAEAFRRAGAKDVTILDARTSEEVDSKKYLDAMGRATGVWFGGGRQWRFVDAYLGTQFHELMHGVLDRGGVIAGSSAGASIQAEYMARGTPIGNTLIMADGYERGLGFLSGVAIDQHFKQRNRFADMTQLVTRYPQILGIGIDESTAIIVRGHVAEVVGRGSTHFYDATKKREANQKDYDSVSAGGRYDLKARRIIPEIISEAKPASEPRPPEPAATAK